MHLVEFKFLNIVCSSDCIFYRRINQTENIGKWEIRGLHWSVANAGFPHFHSFDHNFKNTSTFLLFFLVSSLIDWAIHVEYRSVFCVGFFYHIWWLAGRHCWSSPLTSSSWIDERLSKIFKEIASMVRGDRV